MKYLELLFLSVYFFISTVGSTNSTKKEKFDVDSEVEVKYNHPPMCLCARMDLDANQDSQHEAHAEHITCCLSITQAQHGAGLAAAVALLRPVSSQPVSSEAHPALSGVAAQRSPLRRLSAAAAELIEVSLNTPCHTSRAHSSQQHAPRGVYETESVCEGSPCSP